MRIKKSNSKVNQDITFDTIADRNEATKTLIDGDMVKVLDASNDPVIQSGWAVYRFCFETQTFDLVEKELQEKAAPPMLKFADFTEFDAKRSELEGDELIFIEDTRRPSFTTEHMDVYFKKNYYQRLAGIDIFHSNRWGLFLNSLKEAALMPLQIDGALLESTRMVQDLYSTVVVTTVTQINSALKRVNEFSTAGRIRGLKIICANSLSGAIVGDLSSVEIDMMGHTLRDCSILHVPIIKMFTYRGYPFVLKNGGVEMKQNLSSFIKLIQPISSVTLENVRISGLDETNNKLISYNMTSSTTYIRGCSFIQESATDTGSDIPIKISIYGYLEAQVNEITCTDNKFVNNETPRYSRTLQVVSTSAAQVNLTHDETFLVHPESQHTLEKVFSQSSPEIDLEVKSFANIESRDVEKESLYNGQLVKVLDAKEDPEIMSGWAVYRFLKSSETFEIVSRQQATPDGATVEQFTNDDKLRVIDGLQPCPHNAMINEDFDLKVQWSPVVKQIKFVIDNNEYLNVPCLQAATEKTMAINGLNQSISAWGSWLFNSVYYGAYVSKMVTDGTRHVRMIHGLGKFPTLNLTEDEVLVAMVRLEVPESFEAIDPTKLTFYRLWKKGLKAIKPAVAAIPEKWDLDNNTIFQTTYAEKQVLFAPALLQTHRANFSILQDFDLKFSFGETYTSKKTFLLVQAMGGARNIPVMINGVRKYMSIQDEHVLIPDLFGTNFGNQWKYFALRAEINDTDETIKYLNTTYLPSGEALNVQPYVNDTKFLFVQIGVKFDSDMKTISDMKNIKVFKYWKNALAPFDELWAEKTESLTPL